MIKNTTSSMDLYPEDEKARNKRLEREKRDRQYRRALGCAKNFFYILVGVSTIGAFVGWLLEKLGIID